MRSAFSLVELVVVVVVIGIIASIAVPRFSQAVQNSKLAVVKANRDTIQHALDYYVVDHPDDTDVTNCLQDMIFSCAILAIRIDPAPFFGAVLTESTNSAGAADPNSNLGPYLKSIPPNQLVCDECNSFSYGMTPSAGPSAWAVTPIAGEMRVGYFPYAGKAGFPPSGPLPIYE